MLENTNSSLKEAMPNTEVVAKAKRKQFAAGEKLRILREVDACQGSGEIGALLRTGRDLFVVSDHLAQAKGTRGVGWAIPTKNTGRSPIQRPSNWPSCAASMPASRAPAAGRNNHKCPHLPWRAVPGKRIWHRCLARHSRHPTWTIRVDDLGRALGRKCEAVESLSGAGCSQKQSLPAATSHRTTCSS